MAKQAKAVIGAAKVPAGFVGYEFRVKGRFITKPDADTGKRSVVTFTESVLVPATAVGIFDETTTRHEGVSEDGKPKVKVTSFKNYLGRLKKKLVPMKLQARDANFSAIREFFVEEVIGHGGADITDLELPLSMMSMTQLKQYCQFHSISKSDIDPAAYVDVCELREDLWNYREDKEAFKAMSAAKKGKRAIEREFMALNAVNGVEVSTVGAKPLADDVL